MNDYRSVLEGFAAVADADLLPGPAAVRAAGDRRTRRSRRARGVLVGAATVLALAVALVLVGHDRVRSSPEPAKPPSSTIPGGEVVAAQPFL